jgi:cell division septation protein DedD
MKDAFFAFSMVFAGIVGLTLCCLGLMFRRVLWFERQPDPLSADEWKESSENAKKAAKDLETANREEEMIRAKWCSLGPQFKRKEERISMYASTPEGTTQQSWLAEPSPRGAKVKSSAAAKAKSQPDKEVRVHIDNDDAFDFSNRLPPAQLWSGEIEK